MLCRTTAVVSLLLIASVLSFAAAQEENDRSAIRQLESKSVFAGAEAAAARALGAAVAPRARSSTCN
jgi:hypothetical protein